MTAASLTKAARRAAPTIRRMFREGANDVAIATALSMSRWTIKAARLALGLRHLRRGVVDRHRIDALCAEGWNCVEIAKELGLDPTTVRDACAEVSRRVVHGYRIEELPSWATSEMEFARLSGWPPHLRVREVQVLNLLWDGGPMTTKEIAASLVTVGESRICNLCTDLARRKFVLRTPRIDHKSFVILAPEFAMKRGHFDEQ